MTDARNDFNVEANIATPKRAGSFGLADAGQQALQTKQVYDALAVASESVAPLSSSFKLVAKKTPIIGALFSLWKGGQEVNSAIRGKNAGLAWAAAGAGTVETVGNLVGFGVGDALREAVRAGVSKYAGQEYTVDKSDIRNATETGSVVVAAHLKTLSKTADQIAQEQAALLRGDETLPQTVRIAGNDVALADALRNPVFNKTFIDALKKQGESGTLDAVGLIAKVQSFNDLEMRRLAAVQVESTVAERLAPAPQVPV